MNKFLIGAGAVVVAIALFFLGHTLAPEKTPSLGSYTPSGQSSSGFSQSISTSTSLAANSLCNPTNIQFLGTTALATATIAAATSSYSACASPAFGFSSEGLFVNDSTNTVNLVAGTGVAFLCETNDVGTSTISGVCTASQVSIPATSTMYFSSYFDSSSSTQKIIVGNTWH